MFNPFAESLGFVYVYVCVLQISGDWVWGLPHIFKEKVKRHKEKLFVCIDSIFFYAFFPMVYDME